MDKAQAIQNMQKLLDGAVSRGIMMSAKDVIACQQAIDYLAGLQDIAGPKTGVLPTIAGKSPEPLTHGLS